MTSPKTNLEKIYSEGGKPDHLKEEEGGSRGRAFATGTRKIHPVLCNKR